MCTLQQCLLANFERSVHCTYHIFLTCVLPAQEYKAIMKKAATKVKCLLMVLAAVYTVQWYLIDLNLHCIARNNIFTAVQIKAAEIMIY